MLERELGPDHYNTITALSTTASILNLLDRCEPALRAAQTVHQRMHRVYGGSHQATLIELGNLGYMQSGCGHRTDAIASASAAIKGLREHHGTDNAAAQSFTTLLARLLVEENRAAEAWPLVQDLEPTRLRSATSDPGSAHRLAALKGRILIKMDRAEEGIPMLRDAIQSLEALSTEAQVLEPLRKALDEALSTTAGQKR